MDTLDYILNKYNLDTSRGNPIEIPDTGRTTLASIFHEVGYKVGAEIGVAEGRYSEVICKANPGVKLYCVDAWQVYDGYRDYTDPAKLSPMFNTTRERLKGFDVTYLPMFSMDACKQFENNSLDFVYIDANHEWPYVTQDIYYWNKKVRPGGIISGHDYYRSTRLDSKCHVKSVVNCYTYTFRVAPWFILGTDAKTPGLLRDASRSWFWVKA